jgi:release factor glutamine methyltransferase
MSASQLRTPVSGVATALREAGCVFAEEEARVLLSAAATPAALVAMMQRRMAGEPLEQIVGWTEFCGCRVAVDPGVFVPRRRTELLAREAADLAQPGGVVVDLCCGSGAVAAALLATTSGRGLEVHAVDIDSAATACARRNLAPVGGRVHHGDLYDALPTTLRGRVDILVANAPYVPTRAVSLMPREARDHEPPSALDGGNDGLDVLRRIVAGARQWLAPKGHLLIETSRGQASYAMDLLDSRGLVPQVVRSDELDATVVIGRLAPP